MLGRSHVLEVVLDDVVPLLVLNCVSRNWVRVCVVLGVGEEPGGGLCGGVQDDVVACVSVGDVEPDMSPIYPYGPGQAFEVLCWAVVSGQCAGCNMLVRLLLRQPVISRE